MVYRRRRRQRGGVFRGKNRQRGRGLFSKLKKNASKYGRKYGRRALSYGKRQAISSINRYAPVLMAKGLRKLNQMGSGQRGRGDIGKALGAAFGSILPF